MLQDLRRKSRRRSFDQLEDRSMRNLVLIAVLIVVPVSVFAAGYTWLAPHTPSVQTAATLSPDSMAPFAAIVSDVQTIAASGDLSAAGKRITDLETAWDKAQPTIQPINPAEWGYVDGAIDNALGALRVSSPDVSQVHATLARLQIALADPSHGGKEAKGRVMTISGIATTDANGHPLPCETMLKSFRAALAKANLSGANRTTVATLEAKGTERCNADDDSRANAFLAQGIALMAN